MAPVTASAAILAGIVGAISPDFDLLFFYLVDHRQVHHHKYPSHWPITWLILSAACALLLRLSSKRKTAFIALVFCLGGMLHTVLDSIVGDIWWFAPFVDKAYSLITVHAVYKPWWLNFILNWSFAGEIVICTWALLLYRRRVDTSLKRT